MQQCLQDRFTGVVDESLEYVALQRQLIRVLVAEWYTKKFGAKADRKDLKELKQSREAVFVRQERHQDELRHSSVEDNPDRESERSLKIDRVQIENFRAIDHLEFRFGTGSPDEAGWMMLLGENGVGKSSILQAVALALMGAEHARKLRDVDPTTVLRRGTRSGVVRVFLAAEMKPVEMHLRPHGLAYSTPDSRLRTTLLGFGSARWLPRKGGFPPDRGDFMRCRNLFNPFVPLADTLNWLRALPPGEFRKTETALLRLLKLEPGDRLRRRRGVILVQPAGKPISRAYPIQQLSDGYQAALAMVGDILELLNKKRVDMAAAEGVVLIDEIGAHLHPRWQMEVVTRLRSAFPHLQFLATTHDPLCLRGVRDNEVIVLRRDSRQHIVALTELPAVEGLRPDQLLTSAYFGLNSAMDENIERLFDEYYALLAKPKTTKPEAIRLKQLQQDLQKYELLGANRRERLMLEAIDDYLAKQADAVRDGQGEQLKASTRAKLASILERVGIQPVKSVKKP